MLHYKFKFKVVLYKILNVVALCPVSNIESKILFRRRQRIWCMWCVELKNLIIQAKGLP